MNKTMRECWLEDATTLLEKHKTPSRGGETREIIGHSYEFSNPLYCWAGGGRQGHGSLGYGFAELLWYLSGKNTIELLGAYAPSYLKYTNDGKAMGAYGYRWRNNPGILQKSKDGSFVEAVELLFQSPDDRRAVVAMWDSGDVAEANKGEWKDYPCTLSLQMLIRNNKLNMITTMRSNDLWLGGIYDPFTFSQLQILAAAALGAGLGAYYHRAGSFHMYSRNEVQIKQELKDSINDESVEWKSPMPQRVEARDLITCYDQTPLARAEEIIRNDHTQLLEAISLIPNDYSWSLTALKAMHYHLSKKKV